MRTLVAKPEIDQFISPVVAPTAHAGPTVCNSARKGAGTSATCTGKLFFGMINNLLKEINDLSACPTLWPA